MAHRTTQLAIEVLTLGKTWEEAIATDWRNTKDWKPGWEYEIQLVKYESLQQTCKR